jgi:hypothetical protein
MISPLKNAPMCPGCGFLMTSMTIGSTAFFPLLPGLPFVVCAELGKGKEEGGGGGNVTLQ